MEEKLVGWGWAAKGYLQHIFMRYAGMQDRDYKAHWAAQEGKCAGCRKELAHPWLKEMKQGLRPEVDHSHATGKVRGLLCRRCNDFLGKILDNADTLQNLVNYLKRNGELP